MANFLTFNPYFEWERDIEISFQARHVDIAPYLMRAIDVCTAAGVEANDRYMPPCQLPGYEQHVSPAAALPTPVGRLQLLAIVQPGGLVLPASRRQRERHNYHQVPACDGCAVREICDGFHAQYVARWGGGEAVPYPGPPVTDPRHFIRHQDKYQYWPEEPGSGPEPANGWSRTEMATPLGLTAGGGAGARHKLAAE